jgi:hypothetical protein
MKDRSQLVVNGTEILAQFLANSRDSVFSMSQGPGASGNRNEPQRVVC